MVGEKIQYVIFVDQMDREGEAPAEPVEVNRCKKCTTSAHDPIHPARQEPRPPSRSRIKSLRIGRFLPAGAHTERWGPKGVGAALCNASNVTQLFSIHIASIQNKGM